MSEYRVIVVGGTEQKDVDFQSMACRADQEDCQTIVVAPEDPHIEGVKYVQSSQKGLEMLLWGLESRLPENKLVLYVTGEGTENGFRLADGTESVSFFQQLDSASQGSERTIIMDQRFAGKWQTRFTDDPKTAFVYFESVNKGSGAAMGIGAKLMTGGAIDLIDNYYELVKSGLGEVVPHFVSTSMYSLFLPLAHDPLHYEYQFREDEFEYSIRRDLKPGRFAIVIFIDKHDNSGDRPEGVQERASSLAHDYGFYYKVMLVENPDIAARYGVDVKKHPGFGMVVISGDGTHKKVEDVDHPEKTIAEYDFSIDDYLHAQLRRAVSGDKEARARYSDAMSKVEDKSFIKEHIKFLELLRSSIVPDTRDRIEARKVVEELIGELTKL